MSNVTITIEGANVSIIEQSGPTASFLYSTGAFDSMLRGTAYRPAQKIETIKMVRQISGQSLKECKDAMDARLDTLGIPRYVL